MGQFEADKQVGHPLLSWMMPKRRLQELASRMSAEGLRSPSVWVDAWHDDGAAGWLLWPESAGRMKAVLNGVDVPLALDMHGRPDVSRALGTDEPAHGVRFYFDAVGLAWNEHVRLEVSGDAGSVLVHDAPAGEILVGTAYANWADAIPAVVRQAAGRGWQSGIAVPSLADAAVVDAIQKGPGGYFTGAEQAAQRDDLRLSPFQTFSYHRHVRGHPSYRTHRHFTLATRDETVRFLVWSLRNFANAHRYAPLPVGPADLEHLNAPCKGSGLGRGRASGLVALHLTDAQAQHAKSVGIDSHFNDEDAYVDLLLGWLGSWGWGHRGDVLLTQGQQKLLRRAGAVHDGVTVGAVTAYNNFVEARLREHSELSHRLASRHLVTTRVQALMELLAGELLHVGTDRYIAPELRAAMTTTDGTAAPDAQLGARTEPVRVRVIGMLTSRSGLGQNARHSVAALQHASVSHDTLSVSLNDRSVPEQTLSLRSVDAANVNLWHMNPDNLPEAVAALDPGLYERSYNIGFFAWELDRQPRAHMLALDWIDELWVPSEYCAKSFRTATHKPIIVMPHCLVIPPDVTGVPRSELGVADSAFIVHSGFDMHSWPQRKNPLGSIQAFKLAFPSDPDVRLLLKIRNGGNIGLVDSDLDGVGEAVLELADADERILVDIEERSYRDTLGLLAGSDCHLSLHRSEGFGYGVAEALALGVPVVASDFSATSEFATSENAWLVPADVRLLEEGEYYLAPPGASWGEPDIEAAAQILRDVRSGGAPVEEKVANGVQTAAMHFTLARMADRYSKRLKQIDSR